MKPRRFPMQKPPPSEEKSFPLEGIRDAAHFGPGFAFRIFRLSPLRPKAVPHSR
jgi:hypothetical protein